MVAATSPSAKLPGFLLCRLDYSFDIHPSLASAPPLQDAIAYTALTGKEGILGDERNRMGAVTVCMLQ